MAPSARVVVQRVVKRAAAAFDVVRRPPRGIVVLLYHRVGRRSDLEVDLPTGLFAAQIEHLAATGRVRTLEACLDVLGDPGAPSSPRSRDPIAITFDDGSADFAEIALPILERHRLPVTLYLATAFVDERRALPGDGTPLSWPALRDVQSTGLVTFGSHTHTHALLDRIAPVLVAQELDRSCELIAAHLGRAPEHFAYPKAVRGTREAETAVRARFRSAAVAGTRANPYGRTDPYRLARSPIQAADGMTWFRHKIDGGMGLEDSLRRLANRRRYAGATT
jgi:peptidoglycan/xylan/chitin deacetylase (PgdA/CDA1 family)